jgi:hypothetical protein
MLYLAEIQKKRASLLGSVKAELRLLACQGNEQRWNALPGEEIVEISEAVHQYGNGVLVLVDINADRQLQSPLQEASRHFVMILQNHARQIERYKIEAEEIASWRQSLDLQADQLLLRQAEIYSQEEEIEATRVEIERLFQKSQILEETLQVSERQLQELVDAWENSWQRQRLLEQQSIINSLITP